MKDIKCVICNHKIKLFKKDLFDDRYGAPGYYSVYRCSHCGFGRTFPTLKKNEIGKFYSKYYPLKKISAADVKKQVDNKSTLKRYLMGVNNVAHQYVTKGKDVLDVGSSSGVSLLEIKKIGANAYGVEPDPNSVRLAKKLNLNVQKGFITDKLFKDKKFDYVTASQVIEHEPDPLKFLIAARKKLKKGGKIILSFPNLDAFYRKIFGKRWIHWHVPYHINHFTNKSFAVMSKKAGLEIVSSKTITPNLWTALQFRMLLFKANEGKTSEVWVVKKGSKKTKDGENILNRVISGILPQLPILITPVNRFIDLLGYGESFLVVLEKNE